MTSDILFFRQGFLPDTKLILQKEELAHLQARRISSGRVEIRDGNGKAFVYAWDGRSKELVLVEEIEFTRPNSPTQVAIALPKGNRLDFFLQKSTEMGLSKVTFLIFRHSIRKEFNLDRALRIVEEASAQSRQSFLMEIELQSFPEWLGEHAEEALVFHPRAEVYYSPGDLRRKIPIIGPEGGFHEEEEKELTRSVPFRKLPGGILRTETAGLVAVSLLRYAEFTGL